MKSYNLFYLLAATALILFGGWHFLLEKQDGHIDKKARVALRNTGHQLLLQYQDSTSLVSPIEKINTNSYRLSFQSELRILPDSLESSIRNNFKSAGLKSDFIVEVIRCNTQEVSYSYIQTPIHENTIVPCQGRELPLDCYDIIVTFQANSKLGIAQPNTALFLGLLLALIGFILHIKRYIRSQKLSKLSQDYTTVGNYKFYKNQNKLVREEIVIELTTKECEIMTLLCLQPNEIVKRETLVKHVWEDKGVVVGRSLDTYISKIRKKINDDSIKIVNIHGVGYRLEIS